MGEGEVLDFMEILLEAGIDDCWPHFTNLIVVIKTKDGEIIKMTSPFNHYFNSLNRPTVFYPLSLLIFRHVSLLLQS